MMHSFRTTARLVRLYLRSQRAQIPFLLSNAILFPATLFYLGMKVSSGGPDDLRAWMAGAVTLSLGQTVVNNVGFNMLQDRFMGRAELLRAWPVNALSFTSVSVLADILFY